MFRCHSALSFVAHPVPRWAKWSWRVSGILVGASEAKAQILRHDGDVIEYHAATVPLELHGADTESQHGRDLGAGSSIYVVMRDNPDNTPLFDVILATASAYEAQVIMRTVAKRSLKRCRCQRAWSRGCGIS